MSTEPNYKATRAAVEELSPLHLSAIDNVGYGCYKEDGHGVFRATDKKMCESIVTIVNTSIALLDRIEELEARVKSEDEVRNAKPHDAFDALDIDYLCMLASHGSAVVRGGWLRTFAKKIKNALDALEAKDKEIKRLLRLVLRQKDTMHTVYSMVSNEIHHANIELNGGMIPKCSDCDYLECDHYSADKDACKQVRLKALKGGE